MYRQYVSIREEVRRRTLELGEDAQAVPITVRQLEASLPENTASIHTHQNDHCAHGMLVCAWA